MITIARATPEDAPLVARLHVQGWRDGYAGLIPQDFLDAMSVDERAARWLVRLQEGSTIWIASYGGEPAAIIGFGQPINPVPDGLESYGELTLLYTIAPFYRHGLATYLFRHAAQSLADMGFAGFFLWVLKENEAGRAFYGAMKGVPIYHVERDTQIGGETFSEIAYCWEFPSV